MNNRQQNFGRVVGVNGNIVKVKFSGQVLQNEICFIHLNVIQFKAEVIRILRDIAECQVFEDTTGLRVGNDVEFTGELLSVELGPGLLGQVFDGLQNPLHELAKQDGIFIKRGSHASPLPDITWNFIAVKSVGETVCAGMRLGYVMEKGFKHAIMVPFHLKGRWTLTNITANGDIGFDSCIGEIENGEGEKINVGLSQRWPVKLPLQAYAKRDRPYDPLVTQLRIIDSFFPIAMGGTFCAPGPFGAGKTVLQHLMCQHARVDVVIVAACGERAGEVVEMVRSFPELLDPRSQNSLMDRTIIICNTSSMPVAAREASVYTAVTMAEYYRLMGLHVLLLADSTSRWAQAMREISGRLEEIPGEEAFPAYLEKRIASFYERAGMVENHEGMKGSLTIGGTVSPAGGNFEEPVTQASLKVAGAFLGLSSARAEAHRYLAIDPLDSWSTYSGIIGDEKRELLLDILRQGNEVKQMMQVIGEEGTDLLSYIHYLKSELIDAVYLQQNAFDPVDQASSAERQNEVLECLLQLVRQEMNFADKDEAREFFLNVREHFINWNGMEYSTDEFNQEKITIESLLNRFHHDQELVS